MWHASHRLKCSSAKWTRLYAISEIRSACPGSITFDCRASKATRFGWNAPPMGSHCPTCSSRIFSKWRLNWALRGSGGLDLMPPKIFVTQPISEKALARLRQVGDVEINPDSTHIITKPELMAALDHNDYLLCLLHDRVDAEVISVNPNLRLIASMAITPSGVDVAAATARRIPV